MGGCLTRHPADTSRPSSWFVGNTVGVGRESTPSNVNGLCPQTSSTAASDAGNTSATTSPQLKPRSGEGQERKPSQASERIRQAFLDGTLHLDPRCPLDARQLYTLTKSWKMISRNLLVTAVNIFVRMFETNHEMRTMFSSVKDVATIAEMRANKLLEGHAMKVIGIIDDIITNMDDMDYVIKLLQLNAHSHCQRFLHFDAKFFWHIEDPFMLAVKEELGDRFTLNVETAYSTMIRFVLTKMSSEVRHYQSWDESKLTFKSRRT